MDTPIHNESSEKSNSIELNAAAISFLLTISKWAKFFAILGFIFMAIMVLGVIYILGFAPPSMSGGMGQMPMVFLAVIYLILAAVYYFPIMYLYNFSNTIKSAVRDMDTAQLTRAFMYLKNHYQFVGILTIAFISLYLLIIVIAVFFGMMMN